MGVPIDGVGDMRLPAISSSETLKKRARVCGTTNGAFEVTVDGPARQLKGNRAGRRKGDGGTILAICLTICTGMLVGFGIELGKEGKGGDGFVLILVALDMGVHGSDLG